MSRPDPVKSQYEELPYPPRNPEDERRRLIRTVLDSLALLNHYGFGGRRDFSHGFRALVAGGGTGDAVIHLAEQLRDTDARICYLDVSARSMEIARERAKQRGIESIEWHKASLLDLPGMDLGSFDYINCSGVLHHLADRVAGLQALSSVLDDHGVMAIMVYSRHMRAPVYQMQDLLRRLNDGVSSSAEKIENARRLLRQLPTTNLFKAQILRHKAELESGDAALYDLLLHSRDEPFSVPELYDYLASCGLGLIEFVSPIGQKIYYRPETFISDEALLSRVAGLPPMERQAIADLLGLGSANHSFYCARLLPDPPRADDPDMVPFFFPETARTTEIALQVADSMRRHRLANDPMRIELSLATVPVPTDELSEALARGIDGSTPIGSLLASTAASLGKPFPEVQAAFRRLYEAFHAVDWMLLRHKSVAIPVA